MAFSVSDFNVVGVASPDAKEQFQKSLDYLANSETATSVLNEAISQQVPIYLGWAYTNLGVTDSIQAPTYTPGSVFNPDNKTLYWGPTLAQNVYDDNNQLLGAISPSIVLIHELAHALNVQNSSNADIPDPQYDTYAERMAVQIEAWVAKELGELQRTNHNGAAVLVSDSTMHQNGVEVYWRNGDGVVTSHTIEVIRKASGNSVQHDITVYGTDGQPIGSVSEIRTLQLNSAGNPDPTLSPLTREISINGLDVPVDGKLLPDNRVDGASVAIYKKDSNGEIVGSMTGVVVGGNIHLNTNGGMGTIDVNNISINVTSGSNVEVTGSGNYVEVSSGATVSISGGDHVISTPPDFTGSATVNIKNGDSVVPVELTATSAGIAISVNGVIYNIQNGSSINLTESGKLVIGSIDSTGNLSVTKVDLSSGEGIGLIESITQSIGDIVDSVIDTVGDVIESILETIGDAIESIAETVGDVIESIAEAISDVFESIGEVISDVFESIGDAIGDFWDWITGDDDDVRNDANDAEDPDPVSPIMLDLDGNGVTTKSLEGGTYFDFADDGFAEKTGWVSATDGLLVRDLNGNGIIDSGKELFGDNTLLNSGETAANGFEALAELDSNQDGQVDAQDAAFSTLRVWVDANGNGFSEGSELKTLADAGVASLSTQYTNSSLVDANGNTHAQISTYTKTDGSVAAAVDVWLEKSNVLTQEKDLLAVPDEIKNLIPNVRGVGTMRSLHQAIVRDESGQMVQLVQAFEAASSHEERKEIFDQLFLQWTGADSYAQDSRGSYIQDGRHVYAYEAIFGTSFVQEAGINQGTPNPGPNAAADIDGLYRMMLDNYYGLMIKQLEIKQAAANGQDTTLLTIRNFAVDFSAKADEFIADIQVDRAGGIARMKDYLQTYEDISRPTTQQIDAFKALMLAGTDNAVLAQIDDVFYAVRGTRDADLVAGTDAGDTLYGMKGNDRLLGKEGDDHLIGGEGNDYLDGGAGADLMEGGTGDDTYVVGRSTDIVVESAGEGVDTVRASFSYTLGNNLENLTLTGTATRGTGNDLDNVITGNAANNALNGGAGNDSLYGGAGNDSLNGGTGADLMIGGTGNDSYVVGHSGDVIVENTGEGVDTVTAHISYTLGDNVENLTLAGTARRATGNALDNVLTGNASNNTLTGGLGNDTYVFNRNGGQDTVVENDASVGNTDVLQFGGDITAEQLWFAQSGNDLQVSIIGTSDTVRISNWYVGEQYRVEQFKTADGHVLLDSQVQNLVNAMSAFAPPAAGQTSLAANDANILLPVLVANWQ